MSIFVPLEKPYAGEVSASLISQSTNHNQYDASSDYYELCPFELVKHKLYKKGESLYFGVEYEEFIPPDITYSRKLFRKRFRLPVGKLEKELAEIVDPYTWERINLFLFRDKNNLYCWSILADGGYLNHLGKAHSGEFMFLTAKGWITKSRARKLKSKDDYLMAGMPFPPEDEIDPVDLFTEGDNHLYSFYATDGIDVYYKCNKLNGADINSLKLANGAYTAKDKIHFYDGSSVIKSFKE